MPNDRIALNKKQLEFLAKMLEIQDPQKAVDRFAELMVLESVDPRDICIVIDKIMKKMKD